MCMHVREAAIHVCMRASPVGLTWGGPAAAKGILGEERREERERDSARELGFQGRDLSTFTLPFHSFLQSLLWPAELWGMV